MENSKITPDPKLAFDVGHSSLGWAVLQTTGAKTESINLLGCETVTFGADARCLHSPHSPELAPAHRSRHQRRPGGWQVAQETKGPVLRLQKKDW